MRHRLLILGIGALAVGFAVALAGAGRHSSGDAASEFKVTLVGLAADSPPQPLVRSCAFVPGRSVPAVMPPDVVNPPSPTPAPSPTPPPITTVPSATTARQLQVFNGLWAAVNDKYVYTDFHGRDWGAIGDKYEAFIQRGLSDADFYRAMGDMIAELGDQHSYYQDPATVQEDNERITAGVNYVGIGVLALPLPGNQATIIAVFPGSAAAEGGLKAHDRLLDVNGGPVRDEKGNNYLRGPAGTQLTVKVQTPGEPSRTITFTRRAVSGSIPVDYCLVPNTRIGYILIPTLLDESIDDQVRTALLKMTADGPLAGLVIDNRVNGGGLGSVTRSILGFFTNGVQGHIVSRSARDEIRIERDDIRGTQTVPLVVLVDRETVSYAEIMTGVLQVAGRAKVVGGTSAGNVELLASYSFVDGSRAWLATFAFQPLGGQPGAWEGVGIVPDVRVPTRWDLFTEATDPALAKAIDVLQGR